MTAVHPALLPWKVLGFAGVLKVNVKSEGLKVAPGASLTTVLQMFNVAVSVLVIGLELLLWSQPAAGCCCFGH